MAEHPHPDLGSVLRHEAERHVADRDAMLARIVQRRSEPSRSWRAPTLRPVAAAASVVATLVAGFAGIRLAGEHAEPEQQPPAATEDSPTPRASAAPSPSVRAPSEQDDRGKGEKHSPGSGSGSGSGSGNGSGNGTPAPSWQPVKGFLSSAAAVDGHPAGTWSQGNVTLTTSERISALEVVINVTKSEGVKETGRWSTVPQSMLTSTVTDEKTRLVYRFSLQGTLPPGSYVFAAQYQHVAGGRDPASDTYGALATAGSDEVTVTGVFPAR